MSSHLFKTKNVWYDDLMQELSPQYNPKTTENKIYSLWEKAEAFKPVIDKSQKPFVITIPPPNVTGSLHMGHAINGTIQDILIRRARMRGIPTLWIPGTDHAAIAIQNVIEKQLAKEGTNRQEIGREAFEKRVWAWIDEYGGRIIGQLKSLGCSCDWSRQRFTMDDDYTEAVNAAFKHYFDKGWIYQGERVINWCTRCQTSLSDLEVEHLDQKGKLYYFKYDKNFPITIATTRPETKLGDTAVAVNPKDKRYTDFIDKTYQVNFCGVERKIKIIADPSINMEFGTGAVGVTPAHSLTDYEMAEKHGLDIIKVIDIYGKMTKEAGPFEGLKTSEAAQKVLDQLEQEKLLEKTEEIDNAVSVCYRCNRPIEPQPSKQWFLKMSELAKPAIEAVKSGKIKFTPDHWTKVYLDWMENLHDWCISRQIWFGHRLPVWAPEVNSNLETRISNELSNDLMNSKIQTLNQNSKFKIQNYNDIYVGDTPPKGYEQSTDVLDTWFSSALWPFATLGWPSSAKATDGKPTDLDYFYPTTVMTTARDIIYLWVARMIFSGYEFMGEKPFSEVYIHPTVFNKEGKRMSKSLGTGVDPLELIEKYGADATRFGLTYINTGIQDLKFDEEAILAGKKFANKLWNVARFTMMSVCHPEGNEGSSEALALDSSVAPQNDKSENDKVEAKTDADKVILGKLNEIIKSTDKSLDEFRFGQVAHDLYDFVWHDLADVYIEEFKSRNPNPKYSSSEASAESRSLCDASSRQARTISGNDANVLLHVLATSLKLLHPIMPFVTEEIWQKLFENKIVTEKLLISARWPK